MNKYKPASILVKTKEQAKQISDFYDKLFPEYKGDYDFLHEDTGYSEYPIIVYAGTTHGGWGWDHYEYKYEYIELEEFLDVNSEL